MHTFDCTFNGSSIHARHSYHQICLGRASREAGAKGPAIFSADSRFMAYSDITDMLNHSHVELLKIDIEGMSCFLRQVFRGHATGLSLACFLLLQVSSLMSSQVTGRRGRWGTILTVPFFIR